MAVTYTPIPDSDVDSESPVTTSLITLLRDNPIAMFEKASGAPVLADNYIVQAMIGSGQVGQGELKTTTGTVSVTGVGASADLALPGGSYGFYPQIYSDSGTYIYWGYDDAGVGYDYAARQFSTSPKAGIILYSPSSGSGYARQRYIQASPPYNHGDGTVGLYMFAVVSGSPIKIHSTYVAPEAPWHYNGPTNVAAKYVRDGIPRRMEKGGSAGLLQGIWTPDQIAADPVARKEFLDAQKTMVELEITQEIKHRDMPLIPHPFQMDNYPPDAKVIMLDPVCDCNFELLEMHDAGLEVSDMIRQYIKIGNQKLKRGGPPVDIVGISWR